MEWSGFNETNEMLDSSFGLLLRVRFVDGSEVQGSLQLHSSAEGPATFNDVQRMLR